MGCNVNRLSINWTRAFPNGDDAEPNEEGIEPAKRPGGGELLREGTVDFYSLSHCSTDVCAARPEEHGATEGSMHRSIASPHLGQTERGWTIDPPGLRISLNQAWDRYQTPVMVVESGFVYVDMDDGGVGDLSRSRKDSFYFMQRVYRSNGEDLD